MKKKLIPALFCIGLFFFSCSLTPNIKLGGVADLDKKQEVLSIGTTNKRPKGIYHPITSTTNTKR